MVSLKRCQVCHIFTRGLQVFSGDFCFLILIAQEVEINRGSVPTASVYCSSFNLSPTKLYGKSIIRLVPFATSGDSTTASPIGLLTEASVEYLASGSVEVKKLNLAAV